MCSSAAVRTFPWQFCFSSALRETMSLTPSLSSITWTTGSTCWTNRSVTLCVCLVNRINVTVYWWWWWLIRMCDVSGLFTGWWWLWWTVFPVSGPGLCSVENPVLLETAVWKRCSSPDLLNSIETRVWNITEVWTVCACERETVTEHSTPLVCTLRE